MRGRREKAEEDLIEAASRGDTEEVKAALRMGARINRKQAVTRLTALNAASQNGHLPIVKVLLSNRADVNKSDWKKDTPLNAACSRSHAEVVEALLAARCDKEKQNRSGNGPLNTAVVANSPTIVRMLLMAGCDRDRRDAKGKTPLEMAIEMRKAEMAETLIRHGASIADERAKRQLIELIGELRFSAAMAAAMNPFDSVSDFVLLEIFEWVIGVGPTGSINRLEQLGQLARLSETCKRFRGVTKSPTIWRRVDIGAFFGSGIFLPIVPHPRRTTEKVIRGALQLQHIVHCEKLSLFCGVGAQYVVSLIGAMPNLVDLSINLSANDPVYREKSNPDVQIGENEILAAICNGLPHLQRLSFSGFFQRLSLESISLPAPLQFLRVNAFPEFVPALLASHRGPLPNVKKFRMSNPTNDGIASIVAKCPSLASLSCWGAQVSAIDISLILSGAHNIESLSLKGFPDKFTAVPANFHRCETLRKLRVNVTSGPDMWARLCSSCPNLTTIDTSLGTVSPADIGAMATLKNLSSLSTMLDTGGHSRELAAAFSSLASSPSAVPFQKLSLSAVTFDLTEFFKSPRCSALRKIKLRDSELSVEAACALGEVAGKSLESVKLGVSTPDSALPLLSRCTRLSVLWITAASDELLGRIGAEIRAPLREVGLTGCYFTVTDAGALALLPAIRNIERLIITETSVTSSGTTAIKEACPMLVNFSHPMARYRAIS